MRDMTPIKQLLNRIKYDKRLKPEEFSIFYLDRITNNLIELKYNDIKRLEGSFMVLERDGEEAEIPLHRIRTVKEKERVIWKRQL